MSGDALIESARRKLQSEDCPKNIRLLAFQAMSYLPAKRVQPILDGLRSGMTRRQAAGLAGMSLGELNFVLKLGEQGHPAWCELVDAIRIADSQSLAPTMRKLQEQAEDGQKEPRNVFLKAKDPEFRESQEKPQNNNNNFNGVQIVIRKDFGGSDDPIDAEYENIDE